MYVCIYIYIHAFCVRKNAYAHSSVCICMFLHGDTAVLCVSEVSPYRDIHTCLIIYIFPLLYKYFRKNDFLF